MLSLKKAAAGPAVRLSSRATTSVLPVGGNVHFAPPALDSSHGTFDIPVGPDENDLELVPLP